MKPCSHHRENIAWMAIGALEPHEARQLQEHLQICPGCRRYYAEISQTAHVLESLPARGDIQTSDIFHRRVLTALKANDRQPAWRFLLVHLHNLHWNWRVALPLFATTAILLLSVIVATHRSTVDLPTPLPNHVTHTSAPKLDPEPSILNYQTVANRSLDKLDELMTQQALKPSSSTPIYTASSSKQIDAWE